MTTDLDSMHHGRTGKNHRDSRSTKNTASTDADDNCPGDDDLWGELDTL